MIKNFLILFFFFSSFLFLSGCDFEANAMRLPLSLEIQEDNICVYTNNKRSFLNESNEDAWYLIYANRSDNSKEKKFEQKFMLNERAFPFKKENCILIPIGKIDINKPYGFSLDSGKHFYERACILRKGDGYEVKKVHSTENCDE